MKKMQMIVATLCAVCAFGIAADTYAASIGNTVWNDSNKNGVQDAGEEGIPGVRVKLYHGDEVETDRTNSLGRYKFKDLEAGHYDIVIAQETLPAGCQATYDRDGNKNGKYADKYLHEDDYYTHADFGYYCPTLSVNHGTAPVTGAGSVALIAAAITAAIGGVFVYTRRTARN